MNDELIARARALLALREKATPGPWVLDWNVSRLDVFSSCSAHLVATLRRSALSPTVDDAAKSNAHLIAAAHDMADTIAALLAEVERLQARLRELASAEPVAWGLEAEIYGKGWAVQLPVCPTEEDAERDRQLYGHPASLRTVALIRRPEMPS